jgi:hypothetical protein
VERRSYPQKSGPIPGFWPAAPPAGTWQRLGCAVELRRDPLGVCANNNQRPEREWNAAVTLYPRQALATSKRTKLAIPRTATPPGVVPSGGYASKTPKSTTAQVARAPGVARMGGGATQLAPYSALYR